MSTSRLGSCASNEEEVNREFLPSREGAYSTCGFLSNLYLTLLQPTSEASQQCLSLVWSGLLDSRWFHLSWTMTLPPQLWACLTTMGSQEVTCGGHGSQAALPTGHLCFLVTQESTCC